MLKPPTSPVRILLVDDHLIVRAGLRLLIESHPGLIVVGEASNNGEALSETMQQRPDVILLDLKLGDESGLELLPKLFAVCDHARVLVLTGVTDADMHKHAASLGAMSLVLKEKPVEVLIKAIDKVHHGEIWFGNSLLGYNVKKAMSPAQGRLIQSSLTGLRRTFITLPSDESLGYYHSVRFADDTDRLFRTRSQVHRLSLSPSAHQFYSSSTNTNVPLGVGVFANAK